MMESNILSLCYLAGSITFIIGLKMLSDASKARRGNLIAAFGMSVAILGTIFLYKPNGDHLHNSVLIFCALLIGGALGSRAARRVKMTAMPEMVSLFNGMGGACAALISIVEFDHLLDLRPTIFPQATGVVDTAAGGMPVVIMLGLIIGSISFAGSMIAWGKLAGKVKDLSFRGQHFANILILLCILVTTIWLVIWFHRVPEDIIVAIRSGSSFEFLVQLKILFFTILGLSLLYGVFFVFPIGGADMPVVISLLNSFTGVAAACGGFLYQNKVMLTGGILVGAAGTLLTILMCKAMNRSLLNVLIGSFGSSAAAKTGASAAHGNYKEVSVGDAAVVMNYAARIVIVPGYGLAVAQAQHICHELERLLTEKGVAVEYAIHPVAGRMPGHMNVLLAEADVAYDKLMEMDQANEYFPTTDVVLILGANDVVNPAAKSDPSSPIYGMPILEVEKAKMVIVNKRSMKPGYAGIENPLFFQPKTSMLFGDAKSVLQQLVTEIKNL